MNRQFVLVILLLGLSTVLKGQQRPTVSEEYANFPPKTGRQIVIPYEVVDGDTIRFFYLVPCDRGRLAGIQAPEMHKVGGGMNEAGVASKEALEQRIKVFKPLTIDLKGKEKFGGVMVEPLDNKGDSICEWMVKNGFAKTWDGKGQKPAD